MAPPQPGSARRRTPYNAYVQRDRQQKYYHRKRVFNKYKRFQKFEANQQQSDEVVAGRSLSDSVFAIGADALNDDYERRLALSFGGDSLATDAPPAKKTKKKKKTKRQRVDIAAAVPDVEAPSDGRRKRRRVEPSTVGAYDAALDVRESDATARSRKKVRSSVPLGQVTDHGASAAETGGNMLTEIRPEQRLCTKAKNQASKDRAAAAPFGRFSKDLWKYRQAQEEKEAERQRKQDEIRALHRRRRNSAKGRAVKGQQLSQRNSRGQPRMSSVLEMIATKLAKESRGA